MAQNNMAIDKMSYGEQLNQLEMEFMRRSHIDTLRTNSYNESESCILTKVGFSKDNSKSIIASQTTAASAAGRQMHTWQNHAYNSLPQLEFTAMDLEKQIEVAAKSNTSVSFLKKHEFNLVHPEMGYNISSTVSNQVNYGQKSRFY
jgi:hypothetical protein